MTLLAERHQRRLLTKSPYADVLGLSYLFYYAQRSGKLPKDDNPISWRGDSHPGDKVPGGFYDAGDMLKLNFPLATSISFLSWGALDFDKAYESTGHKNAALSNIKWGADYLLACHLSKTEIVGQIGDPGVDHAFWGRPEEQSGERPFFVWDTSKPASDLAGAMASALASASMVLGDSDYLEHAKQLFEFASAKEGKYSDFYTSATYVYSSSTYLDDLAYAAAWLCRATGDMNYCSKANKYRARADFNPNPYVSWDSVSVCSALLLQGMGQASQEVNAQIESFENDWQLNGSGIITTPKGLRVAPLGGWGNLRHASNAAFMMAMIAKNSKGDNKSKALAFAKSQIDYALGLNGGRSYVVGYGVNPPKRPHHRGASCQDKPNPCGQEALKNSGPNPQLISGALVGGPNENDQYTDDRSDYVSNEIAFDYNAGFTSALAGIIQLSDNID